MREVADTEVGRQSFKIPNPTLLAKINNVERSATDHTIQDSARAFGGQTAPKKKTLSHTSPSSCISDIRLLLHTYAESIPIQSQHSQNPKSNKRIGIPISIVVVVVVMTTKSFARVNPPSTTVYGDFFPPHESHGPSSDRTRAES